MDKRTTVSASSLFWLSVSCASLAVVLWVISNLFIGGWKPAPELNDSALSALNDSGRVQPRMAASDSIAGLWKKMHPQTKAPEQIADTGDSPQAPQETDGQAETIEAGPALQPALHDEQPNAVVPLLAGIKVAFKTDRKQGKRVIRTWVAPYTFSVVQTGNRFIVEAMAQGIGTNGEVVNIDPELTPEDPSMISVSRPNNGAVAISVLRAGQSRLRVASQGISSDLTVSASPEGQGMRVQIFQQY